MQIRVTNAAIAQIESHVIVADVVSQGVDRRERLQICARRRCARKRERQSRVGRIESIKSVGDLDRHHRDNRAWETTRRGRRRRSPPLASSRHAPNARIAIGIVPDRSPRRRRLERVASTRAMCLEMTNRQHQPFFFAVFVRCHSRHRPTHPGVATGAPTIIGARERARRRVNATRERDARCQRE